MKKILFAVIALVLCLGMVGGAFAYFSDTATSVNNTFSAGDVDVTIGGELAAGVLLTGMAPGDEVTKTMWVQNDGSLPIWFAGYISYATETVSGFFDQFSVKVYGVDGDFYGGGPADLIYEGTLRSLYGKENAMVAGEYPPLTGGNWAGYTFKIKLSLDAGNQFQNASTTVKLTVDAIQSNNYTWAQALAILKPS